MVRYLTGRIRFNHPINEELKEILYHTFDNNLCIQNDNTVDIEYHEDNIADLFSCLSLLTEDIKRNDNDIRYGSIEYCGDYEGQYFFRNNTWEHHAVTTLPAISTNELMKELIKRRNKNSKENEIFVKGYIYFPTDAKTAKEGYDEFSKICEAVGINSDNMKENIELRDKNSNPIDLMKT